MRPGQGGVVGPLPAALVDLYSEPHRGLRWALTQLLNQAACTDFQRLDERISLCQQVEHICFLFEQHMLHEEQHIHAALAKVTASLQSVLEEEHAEHRQHMKNLIQLARIAVEDPEQGRCLYLSIARFALENFAHMELEETSVQRALEEHFDWATLQQIHMDLVSSIPPDEMVTFLRVMLPAMSERGQREFLAGPREALPPVVFLGMVEAASLHLTQDARNRLLAWAGEAA